MPQLTLSLRSLIRRTCLFERLEEHSTAHHPIDPTDLYFASNVRLGEQSSVARIIGKNKGTAPWDVIVPWLHLNYQVTRKESE